MGKKGQSNNRFNIITDKVEIGEGVWLRMQVYPTAEPILLKLSGSTSFDQQVLGKRIGLRYRFQRENDSIEILSTSEN